MARPSLLLLTAIAAGSATVANAVGAATAVDVPPSRLGVAIADDLGDRDRAATRRGRALDLREQALRAAEARLKAEGNAAAAPGAAGVPAPGMPGAAPTPDQYDDLARIYQAMKPSAAAVVMEQLELDVQMRVAQKMRERSTASILAAMSPRNAALLTMALARRQPNRPGAPGVTPAPGSAPSGAKPPPTKG